MRGLRLQVSQAFDHDIMDGIHLPAVEGVVQVEHLEEMTALGQACLHGLQRSERASQRDGTGAVDAGDFQYIAQAQFGDQFARSAFAHARSGHLALASG